MKDFLYGAFMILVGPAAVILISFILFIMMRGL
jgi:hypothetical protein